MQHRGGDYARRRGEALAVSRLARRGDTNDPSELDPAIIAAQGQAWLRRGDKERAARLLAAAAAAQRDPDRSIKRAAESAAAFIAAGQAGEASRVLQTVALARPTAQQAAATHLQAAVLISRMEPVNADELESVLRTNLRKWPKGKTAGVVRGWLIKLLRSQRRFTDAAIIATTIVPQEIDAGRMQTAIELWNRAFEAASTSRDEEIRRQMIAAFEPITESPFAVAAFRLLAGIQLPTSQLADLPARAADRSAAERQRFLADFVDALIQFRRRRVAAAILRSPPLELRSAAETRLMQDGRSQRQRRQAIAQLVQQWPTSDQSNLKESIAALNKIERLVWLGQTAAALQLLDTLLEVYSQDVELIGEAASRLAAAGTPETQQRAVELWDQLAGGTSTGSQRWHEARLSAIELLLARGESEEASKRARYILLTTKSIPVEFRERYEAAAKKFSSSSSESGTSEP